MCHFLGHDNLVHRGPGIFPSTVVDFEYDEEDGKRIFHWVFLAYKTCIDAFNHLKPIIQLDETFFYVKYKGTLLIVSRQDGNHRVVPLSFAIVEHETYCGSFF